MNDSMKHQKQVSYNHYQENYDGLSRFISYYYQIDLTTSLNVSKCLEIGIGNRTVSSALMNRGVNVTTCDFDPELKPDYVADIRELPFENNSYELVMACQVLEHLPWSDFHKALSELKRVSGKFIIISLPYSSLYFELVIKFPFLKHIIKKPCIDFCIRIPLFFKKFKPTQEHQWEIGWKGYSIRKIRGALQEYFDIIDEKRPVLNPYHHFFILEKKR